MMRRYYLPTGTVRAGSSSIDTYLVIRTDEVPDHEVRAKGFRPVDPALSDAEVKARYGVTTIATVTNDRLPVM